MKIYCMCGHNQFIAIQTLPNSIKESVIGETIKLVNQFEHVVRLTIPMEVKKIGAAQVILADSNSITSRHYPNVDIRVCKNCGSTIIALE